MSSPKFSVVIETNLALEDGTTNSNITVKKFDNVSDITQYTDNVKIINCENITSDDLNALSVCTNLKALKITNLDENVSDLNTIANFKNLEKFTLARSNVSDITAISVCSNLKSISITDSAVADITPIINLSKLEEINFTDNSIGDIKPLSELGKNQFKANMMQSSTIIEKLTRDMMSALMQLSNFKTQYELIQSGEISQPNEDELRKLIEFNGQQTKFFEMLGIKSVIQLEMILENADKNFRHFAKLLKKKYIDEKIMDIVNNILYSNKAQTSVAASVIRGAIITGENPCKAYLDHRAERLAHYYGYMTRKEQERRIQAMKNSDDKQHVDHENSSWGTDGYTIIDDIPDRFYDDEFQIENIGEFTRVNGLGSIKEFETNYNHPNAVKMAKAGDINGLKQYFLVEYPSILSIAMKLDGIFAKKYEDASIEYLTDLSTSQQGTSTEIPIQVSKEICEKLQCRILQIFEKSITDFISKFETFDDVEFITKSAKKYVDEATSHIHIKDNKNIINALTKLFEYPLHQARLMELYTLYPTYERMHIDLPQSFVLEEIVKSMTSFDDVSSTSTSTSNAIVKMNFLKTLNISKNKIAEAKIEHFHNLKDLVISHNNLQSDTFECDALNNLEKFDCSVNNLTNIEKSFANTTISQTWGGLMQVMPQFRVSMFVSTLYNFTQHLAKTGNLATTFDAIAQ